MNLHKLKNRNTFTGLALIFTFAMLITAFPVSADDAHETPKTKVQASQHNAKEQKSEDKTIDKKESKPEPKEESVEKKITETEAEESAAPAVNASNTAPSSDPLTPQKGVVYYNGHRETYYSQKVLPGTGLDIPGRHVAEDGTIRDADNYICVASSDLAKGTVVETSLGTGKVYDTGCASGTIDIYTNW